MLSSSPTVVQAELSVDLPAVRDQLHTRADPRFTALRTRVYEQIQAARRGTAAGLSDRIDERLGADSE
jgi:NitT/TauT family transport system ATP-binding protein